MQVAAIDGLMAVSDLVYLHTSVLTYVAGGLAAFFAITSQRNDNRMHAAEQRIHESYGDFHALRNAELQAQQPPSDPSQRELPPDTRQ